MVFKSLKPPLDRGSYLSSFGNFLSALFALAFFYFLNCLIGPQVRGESFSVGISILVVAIWLLDLPATAFMAGLLRNEKVQLPKDFSLYFFWGIFRVAIGMSILHAAIPRNSIGSEIDFLLLLTSVAKEGLSIYSLRMAYTVGVGALVVYPTRLISASYCAVSMIVLPTLVPDLFPNGFAFLEIWNWIYLVLSILLYAFIYSATHLQQFFYFYCADRFQGALFILFPASFMVLAAFRVFAF